MYSHYDYAIQFLSDKNTDLACLQIHEITSDPLMFLTNNFTNHATHHNCAKIKTILT